MWLLVWLVVTTRDFSLRSVHYCSEPLRRTTEGMPKMPRQLGPCWALPRLTAAIRSELVDPRSCQLLDWLQDHAASCCRGSRSQSPSPRSPEPSGRGRARRAWREAAQAAQAEALLSAEATAEAEASAGAWELAETPPRTPTLRRPSALGACWQRMPRAPVLRLRCLRPPSPPRDDLTPEAVTVESQSLCGRSAWEDEAVELWRLALSKLSWHGGTLRGA